MRKVCGKACGASMTTKGMALSQHLHLLTNLEAIQTLSGSQATGIPMEASSCKYDLHFYSLSSFWRMGWVGLKVPSLYPWLELSGDQLLSAHPLKDALLEHKTLLLSRKFQGI